DGAAAARASAAAGWTEDSAELPGRVGRSAGAEGCGVFDRGEDSATGGRCCMEEVSDPAKSNGSAALRRGVAQRSRWIFHRLTFTRNPFGTSLSAATIAYPPPQPVVMLPYPPKAASV